MVEQQWLTIPVVIKVASASFTLHCRTICWWDHPVLNKFSGGNRRTLKTLRLLRKWIYLPLESVNSNKYYWKMIINLWIYLPLEMAIIKECKFHIFSDGQRMQLAIVHCTHWTHWTADSVFGDAAAVAHGEWRWVTWSKGRMTRFRTSWYSWFLRDEINIRLTEGHFRKEGKVYRHSVCWTWPCCRPRGSAMSPPYVLV